MYFNFASWLESRVDQILIGCTMQLRMLYQSQDRSIKDIITGYKALLRLLMAVRMNSHVTVCVLTVLYFLFSSLFKVTLLSAVQEMSCVIWLI